MGSAAAKIVEHARPTLTLLKPPPKPGRPKVMRPLRLIAFERLAKLVDEIGDDMGYKWGWQARAAEELGINPRIVSCIHNNQIDSLGTRVIDQVLAKLRCSISEFLDVT